MKRLTTAVGVAALATILGLVAPSVASAMQTPGRSTGASAVADPTLPPPLQECLTPSIDRLQKWLPSEGTMTPSSDTLLVREGSGYAAKVRFINNEWHTAVVWLGNKWDGQANLSSSAGFWLTYSASDNLYVQLRSVTHWSGGTQWLTALPSTGGKLVTTFVSFTDTSRWTWLDELGHPDFPFSGVLPEVRGMVFVAKTPATLDFRRLRIDGYVPPCTPGTEPTTGPTSPTTSPTSPTTPTSGPTSPTAGPTSPTAGPTSPTAGPTSPTAGPTSPTAGPTSPTPPPGAGAWVANHAYKAGDVVTYNGARYRCLQGHTSLTGWEPPNVPALWQSA